MPAVVLSVDFDNMIARVDYGDGIAREVLIGIDGERVSRGDIVMVHAGVIISKLSSDAVEEHIEFLKDVLGEDASKAIKAYESILELAKSLKKEV
ncbi:HypC/HybG/HupF family hydrogenase formation chaperone [Ignisphaera sp. 4213-co]|uniref:HypC/HybG/HupF family hydrogenase formation chaperone n=1 Tax=Ignisphaera cupida TaxID=3050454 RepID=A0ABD4Z6J0_9CREN|nr:HypC/HybG/HupF family hydrogenase formation chaperone [Ignisphaera sp. 4213-co]MDK6028734.1 HypC/HybG/HupF family hydrogenase formation chaperone [Ignisphaera sp. 4213-co]